MNTCLYLDSRWDLCFILTITASVHWEIRQNLTIFCVSFPVKGTYEGIFYLRLQAVLYQLQFYQRQANSEGECSGGGVGGGRFFFFQKNVFFLQSLVFFFDNFEELQTVLIEVKLIIYIARLTCLPKCHQNIFNTQSFVVWQIVMLF